MSGEEHRVWAVFETRTPDPRSGRIYVRNVESVKVGRCEAEDWDVGGNRRCDKLGVEIVEKMDLGPPRYRERVVCPEHGLSTAPGLDTRRLRDLASAVSALADELDVLAVGEVHGA